MWEAFQFLLEIFYFINNEMRLDYFLCSVCGVIQYSIQKFSSAFTFWKDFHWFWIYWKRLNSYVRDFEWIFRYQIIPKMFGTFRILFEYSCISENMQNWNSTEWAVKCSLCLYHLVLFSPFKASNECILLLFPLWNWF